MTQSTKSLFIQRLYSEERVRELKESVTKASEILSQRESRNVSMGEIVSDALEQYCASVFEEAKPKRARGTA